MSNNFINDGMTGTILTYIEKIEKKITPLACTRFTSRVPRALECTVFLNYDIYYKQPNEFDFWQRLATNVHLTDHDSRGKNIIIETYAFFDEDLKSNRSNTSKAVVPPLENEPINNPNGETKNGNNLEVINNDNSNEGNHDLQQLKVRKVKKIFCFLWPFRKTSSTSSSE